MVGGVEEEVEVAVTLSPEQDETTGAEFIIGTMMTRSTGAGVMPEH